MSYVIAYDIGTTGVKTCIFSIDKKIKMISSAFAGYELYILPGGKAEQDDNEWWQSMCTTTREALAEANISANDIEGISFCAQMQGLVLVDKDGVPVRKPMSYMDQRATQEIKDGIQDGIKVLGVNVVKLLKSLAITGAASLSVKDPMWKYLWVKNNEPENFSRVYKWLDVKECLINKCTGNFVMTQDSAFATMLYDSREGKYVWSKQLCDMFGVDVNHLPDIIKSEDVAGKLTKKAADELGLVEGIPVFGGGGDASLIGVGAGAVGIGDTHIYWGTSGWFETVTDKRTVDAATSMASAIGAQKGRFNYLGEMETAGKCLQWVKDHLAIDEIGVYLNKKDVTDLPESEYKSLYDYLSKTISEYPAGSNGIIFTPWLHGNRCPFEDPYSAGMFFNVKLNSGKTELIRSVIEGVCYHLRWMLECGDKKVKSSESVRFVGGGALSTVTCQILADITGKNIETVPEPQNVGAVGAAAIAALGLGLIEDLDSIKSLIPVISTYTPNVANKEIYDKMYNVFIRLYDSNKKNFRDLNSL